MSHDHISPRVETLARFLARSDGLNEDTLLAPPTHPHETSVGKLIPLFGNQLPAWRFYVVRATEILGFVESEAMGHRPSQQQDTAGGERLASEIISAPEMREWIKGQDWQAVIVRDIVRDAVRALAAAGYRISR